MRHLNFALLGAISLVFSNPALSADWSYPLAYRLAIASNCAYEHITSDAVKCLNATSEFKDISEKQILLSPNLGPAKRDGYLLINSPGRDLILAVRGTQPPTEQNSTAQSIALDWLNDLVLGPLLPPAFEKDGYHKGFLRVWDNIVADLGNQAKAKEWINLAKQKDSAQLFYLTGHSKGAAVALLGTDKICKGGKQAGLPMPDASYAFEPARSLIHKKASADKECFKNTWRFEFGDDIVTHVPLTAEATVDPGKLIKIAYGFRKLINTFYALSPSSKIPDYDSVGNLFYVDNGGTGKVISNQGELFQARVKSLGQHLDNLKLIIHEPKLQEAGALAKSFLNSDDPKTLKQAKAVFLQEALKLDTKDQKQCQTQLSLVDDHILYYQWLTKAIEKTDTMPVTVKDDEIQTLASCCTKGSASQILQCLEKKPDLEAIKNRK